MMEDKKLKKYILACSIIIFLCSLTQKCYCTTTACADSLLVFLLGWAAVFSSISGIVWLANPLLLLSWILLKKNLKVSMFLSMASTLLSLSFLLFDSVIDNEAGHNHQVIAYKTGYWLWVSSTVIMLLGTFVLMLRQNRRNNLKI